MESVSMNTISDPLEYETFRMDKAIEKVSAVLAKYSDHPHAYEYYSAMQECLIALSFAMMEAKQVQNLYRNVKNRLEIMENSVANLQRKVNI